MPRPIGYMISFGVGRHNRLGYSTKIVYNPSFRYTVWRGVMDYLQQVFESIVICNPVFFPCPAEKSCCPNQRDVVFITGCLYVLKDLQFILCHHP